jgi:hypothetical protein
VGDERLRGPAGSVQVRAGTLGQALVIQQVHDGAVNGDRSLAEVVEIASSTAQHRLAPPE